MSEEFECDWCGDMMPDKAYWEMVTPRGKRLICYPCFKQYSQLLYPIWREEQNEKVRKWRRANQPHPK